MADMQREPEIDQDMLEDLDMDGDSDAVMGGARKTADPCEGGE